MKTRFSEEQLINVLKEALVKEIIQKRSRPFIVGSRSSAAFNAKRLRELLPENDKLKKLSRCWT